MEFYFPTETGEQLAFLAATAAALIGCFVLFAPGLTLKLLGLTTAGDRPEGLGATRSAGGLIVGFSGTALLLAQPTVYLAFGAALALAAFARILSIMSDHGGTWRNMLFLVVEIVLAVLTLAYVFGLT
ncbi:hypothetical protein ASE36_16565 [Rhizobium sp. Root274]|uniref:AGROH133_08824 family phage infection protein n=1 Tax=unclassified Rhizobium TaxID=2613769 RepID=UPI000714F3E8|nr:MULTISPECIES: hypothetical protein [unclassified Rhizobium]KQW28062.1 hypothetical protein ASC71_16600 [Rhizobium sp. Root1240]KRD28347.1 hypothetical protein ASE36_16565 [Rhizobium sp. Root274]